MFEVSFAAAYVFTNSYFWATTQDVRRFFVLDKSDFFVEETIDDVPRLFGGDSETEVARFGSSSFVELKEGETLF